MNISLSPFAPENLVSRDGFGSPVPRQPSRLHTQAESGASLRNSSRFPRTPPTIRKYSTQLRVGSRLMLSRNKALDRRDRPIVTRSEGVSQRLPSVYRFIFSREIVRAQKMKQLIGERFVSKKGRASAAAPWVQGARTRRIGGSQKLSPVLCQERCAMSCALGLVEKYYLSPAPLLCVRNTFAPLC